MFVKIAAFATGLIVGAAPVVRGLANFYRRFRSSRRVGSSGTYLLKTPHICFAGRKRWFNRPEDKDLFLSKCDQFCTNRISDQFSRRRNTEFTHCRRTMSFDRLHAEIQDRAYGLVGVSFRNQLNNAPFSRR